MINRLQNFQHSIDHGPPKHSNDSLASRRNGPMPLTPNNRRTTVLTRSRTTCTLPHGAHGIVVCPRMASITGVRQQRQQEVNSFELSAAVDAQAAEISALRGMVSTMMGADSPVTATVQAIATDMTARTMGLMSPRKRPRRTMSGSGPSPVVSPRSHLRLTPSLTRRPPPPPPLRPR